MKQSFLIASLITIVVLGLSYSGFCPNYICVTISICSFITALSFSVTCAIKDAQNSMKIEQSNTVDSIQKQFHDIKIVFDLILQEAQLLKTISESRSTQIEKLQEQVNCVVKELSNSVPLLISEISDMLDKKFKTVEDKSNLLMVALNNNSSELSKAIDFMSRTNKENKDFVSTIKCSFEASSSKLTNSIEIVTNNFKQQVENVGKDVSSLGKCIEEYTESSKLLGDANSSLSSTITQTVVKIDESIVKMDESMSGLVRQNRRLIDDLNDKCASCIEELKSTMSNCISEQTVSMSDNEEKINKSVINLCDTLSFNLRKMEIDIDQICSSVEDMKKMSQVVEKSDKDLLDKIMKVCK